jgi:decaprenyl-phosphate phosphoribosyltransferase
VPANPSVAEHGAGTAIARPRRGVARALLATARPKQWVKNALVIAAPGAAGALGHDDVPVRATLACLAFCLVSSAIYAVNDVRDRYEDRLHPRKRHRPVAAGELSPAAAVSMATGALLAGLVICGLIRPLLLVVAVSYIGLTLSYTFVWRHIVVLDLIAIAGGFVLRAVAGGVAAPVTLSRWFLLVITAAAVMVAAGKRHSEFRRTAVAGIHRRKVLERYTAGRLMAILAASGLVALFAYCMWAAALPSVDGIPWRPLSAIPFAACLARYGSLVRLGAGEAPEELVLGDPLLAFFGVAWLAVFALGVHAVG